MTRVDEVPVVHTPPGGFGNTFPAPFLGGCLDPLVPGAPDLRGLWEVVEVEVDGEIVPDHPAQGHLERIEQAADRMIVTGGGVIHDMRCDGTEQNGVHDVAQIDPDRRIVVVATYENAVHVLRPVGIPVEVTRRLEGDDLIWRYIGFTARLTKLGPPETGPPARTRPFH